MYFITMKFECTVDLLIYTVNGYSLLNLLAGTQNTHVVIIVQLIH